MTETAWIALSPTERRILLQALSAMRESDRSKKSRIDALTIKLVHSKAHPKITIGIERGQVQWTTGNPFRVWICDYDGEDGDLPDLDHEGRRCRIWSEPP